MLSVPLRWVHKSPIAFHQLETFTNHIVELVSAVPLLVCCL
jgi:hypothetical protein